MTIRLNLSWMTLPFYSFQSVDSEFLPRLDCQHRVFTYFQLVTPQKNSKTIGKTLSKLYNFSYPCSIILANIKKTKLFQKSPHLLLSLNYLDKIFYQIPSVNLEILWFHLNGEILTTSEYHYIFLLTCS